MKKIAAAAILVAISIVGFAQTKTITGFTDKSSALQTKTEQQFDAALNAKNIGATIKELSAKPHHVGSPGGKEVADIIYNKYKSWGWDVKIETYQVLFPTPKTRLLEMVSPTVYKAILKEPALKEDATSGQDGQLPTYNCWSADGDVTAELVFVNYGLPADYETLDKLGISVKGKIVIAKYGRSWRGIKPKVAQEHGAVGCIIYSDPKDDGYTAGEVYPKGAFKNEFGVQRGSIMDMVVYPGDPLTPNIGATATAKRLDRSAATNLLKIPVLPISYHDAKPLLEAIEGPVAPNDWMGGLPITYHVGPGKAKVHLKVDFDWQLRPANNVIATIKGSQLPDEWVIRGNHHDAWVNGANDPISGLAALLEEAKAIGDLLKTGWKPKRTLIYCAWDAEEPGLIGSTEWVEDHAAELQQKVVAYINSDANSRGFLDAGGSHALETLMDEISKEVIDPQTSISIFERQKAEKIVNAKTLKVKKELLQKNTLTLEALGSGSDYSSFLQHLGITTLDLGFSGEGEGGEYHSIYDSYDDYSRFKDPTFEYGVALSKTAGRAALRLANADALPFDFRNLYRTINSYVVDLLEMTNTLRETTELENQLVQNKSYVFAKDPKDNLIAPTTKAEVPFIDFSPIQNALKALHNSSEDVAKAWAKMVVSDANKSKMNIAMFQAEQQLLSPTGLPRRTWFKHTIYAPGFYTGYGVKTMPGIREAIEQRDWKETQEQIVISAAAINKLSDYLSALAK
ncbi:MAG: M28 family metallopeptidase [Deinococcales bacterium]|nr:M28 family metallopeptidase [Chitinophagaceae bacterium]